MKGTTRARRASRLHDALGFRRRSRAAGGFTLLEILAALTILAVGVLGVAAGLLFAMDLSSRSRADTQALYLAEEQLEMFRIMSTSDVEAIAAEGAVSNDTSNPISPAGDDSTEYNRQWQIELDTPEPGVMTITVMVNWVDGRGVTRTIQIPILKTAS